MKDVKYLLLASCPQKNLVALLTGREGPATCLLSDVQLHFEKAPSNAQHAQSSAIPYLSRAATIQDFILSSCQLNIFKSNKFIKIV